MSLEFTAKLPENMPATVPVFRLEQPDPGPTSLGRLTEVSQRLGMRGRAHETCTSDDWTMHHEGSWELGVHLRSGALVGRHQARYQRPAERPFEIADDDAVNIATAFVERVALVALDETRPRGVTHLRTAGAEVGGEAKESTVIDAGVVIGRTLKEIDVDGPGGFSMINVDGDGEVVGFRTIWRPVAEAIADVEVRPPDLAYESIERIASTVRGDIEVTKATFGYFEQGLLDAQSFLQPAYTLVYVVRDDEVAFRAVEVTSASEKLFEPLLGAKRFGDRRQVERERPLERRD